MRSKILPATYLEYIKSDHWRTLRASVIAKRGLICEATGIKITRLQCNVHHLCYRNFVDVTESDLMILSRYVHDVLHIWKDQGLLKAWSVDDRKKEVIRLVKNWISEGMPGQGAFKMCRKWIQHHRKTSTISKKFSKWRKKKRKAFVKTEIKVLSLTEQERHNAFASKMSYKLPEPWPSTQKREFTFEELTPF